MRTRELTDDCPIGCGRTRKAGHLMCGQCWSQVPGTLQRDVWHRLRKWVRTHRRDDLDRYLEAREAAIASIT